MSSKPTVSVILPTYNRRGLISRSIRSVLRQTYGDFELIVVDDGSTDGTAAVLRNYRDPRIRIFRHLRNKGAGAARNTGIRQARGDYFAFQDSDDEWLPEKLAKHIAVFSNRGFKGGVVYSDMLRVRKDGTSVYHNSPRVRPRVLIDRKTNFYQVCRLGIQSSVIKRTCLERTGYFNEQFPCLEDLELFIRLSKHYAFYHLQEPLVKYYETEGLSSNEALKPIARRLLLSIYERDLLAENEKFFIAESRLLKDGAGPASIQQGVAKGGSAGMSTARKLHEQRTKSDSSRNRRSTRRS